VKKQIIVNAEDLESRVAILEDGQLAELHIERDPRIVGSIYKARVVSVLPGMDAAFADIGAEKNVFLCADDVGFVTETGVTSASLPRSRKITDRLKEGQQVVVQIVRAAVGSKGARATTRLALPGRYLVLLLSDGRQIGVSRRIEEAKERDRLRKLGRQLRPSGCGLIIRTEAEGHGKRDLEADLKVLLDLRDRLMKKAAQAKAPAVLHQDLTLTYQVIRDAFTDDVSELVLDSKSAYDHALELVSHLAPRLRKRVKRYRGKLPIFHKYGIEEEIDRLLRRRVWLKAGGYISIDEAEAFSAIDVNTGRFTGGKRLADTILRTNLEAAEEVARQLRLRDLGGIIVIDFIDMDRARDRQKVMKTFQDLLAKDRQKTKIVHLSPLGLVEMTRKRRGESLMGILTETCPHCGGLGRVRTPLTIALRIEREIRKLCAEEKRKTVIVRAAPPVASVLVGEGGARSAHLDAMVGRPVYIRADDSLSLEEHEVTATTLANATRAVKLFSKGDEVEVAHLEVPRQVGDEPAHGWCEGCRVEIQGPLPSDGPVTVVVTEASHSYLKGHVKGMSPEPQQPESKPKRRRRRKKKQPESEQQEAAPAAPAAPPAPDTSKKRSRRRRPRSKKKAAEMAPAAPQAAATQSPAPAAPPAQSASAPPAAPAPPEIPETPAAPPRKRVGLLRRGARRLGTSRR